VRANPHEFQVVGLAAGSNAALLRQQAAEFAPDVAALADPVGDAREQVNLPARTRLLYGADGVRAVAAWSEVDVVVSAVVGMAGLLPTLDALEQGRTVVLANKEVLVAAGKVLIETARRRDARIIPADSEHNAVFQCLEGRPRGQLRRLHLTASGGPFRQMPVQRMTRVSPREALAHPRWDMGAKISVDSATLMNKGLEVIEASWLFDLPVDDIDVVIHPQSVVHSMVEMVDGTFLAHLGPTDMRPALQYALAYPRRLPTRFDVFDLTRTGPLEFHTPDLEAFPALEVAYRAAREGGTAPAVLSAADEEAVGAFLAGSIGFLDIVEVVVETLSRHSILDDSSLENILEADHWARGKAAEIIRARASA